MFMCIYRYKIMPNILEIALIHLRQTCYKLRYLCSYRMWWIIWCVHSIWFPLLRRYYKISTAPFRMKKSTAMDTFILNDDLFILKSHQRKFFHTEESLTKIFSYWRFLNDDLFFKKMSPRCLLGSFDPMGAISRNAPI